MTASRLSVGDPTAGNLGELDAIAAVVIGGTSLMGGVGGMPGTVAGALLLAVVANLLNLTGVSPFDQQIVKGLVIIAAVLLAAHTLKRRQTPAKSATPAPTKSNQAEPRTA
jgi:ribose transport system permease protein